MINYKPNYKITNSYWIAANSSYIKTGDIIYLIDTQELYCQTTSGLRKIGKQEVLPKQEPIYAKPLMCSCCGAPINPNFVRCEYCGAYYK